MSEMSRLIEITENIEKQNEEIIRLLRKIAGEEEPAKEKSKLDEFSQMMMKTMGNIESVAPRSAADFGIPRSPVHGSILDTEISVGEVYYLEGCDVFKLTVQNNEISIDNLTGSSDSSDFALLEIIANESIRNNQSLSDATVILTKSQASNLPETLKVCYDEGARKVYMPWSLIPQLVGAPDIIVELLNITFYKTDDELIEMIFGE